VTSCTVLALVIVACAMVSYFVSLKRYRALAAGRAGESFETFRAAFAVDTPGEVLRVVYEQIQLWTGVVGFPVRPDDSLETVYWMDEAIEDELWHILKRCNRVLPKQLHAHAPIITVRDLINFVINCPTVCDMDARSN
jgi:hypothetical protein